ncbi:hypothetical protein [Ramlibacter sp.]|uniref:hypothetical protein n=1 Tax=Ramlibacter sp. TaxID=1917967 RepID=UPI002D5412B8|nr:hypothetical protein [Ramlibacter sp.]HYD77798.1 hypothetical protein [Ramlibacter sp.]
MSQLAGRLAAVNGRPWLLRTILVAALAACGGGGGGGGDGSLVAGDVGGASASGGGGQGSGTTAGTAGMPSGGSGSGGTGQGSGTPPVTPGAPSNGGEVAVIYRVFQLTPYDDGSCHSCVNAAGQMAVTASHAGRFASFFDGPTNTSRLLDPSPSFMWSSAAAMNEAGQVAGGIQMADGLVHAARWTPDAGSGPIPPLDLGAPEGGSSIGAAINEAGQVAGTQSPSPGFGSSSPQRAFLWTEGSGRMDLGEPPAPFTHTTALHLNEAAQVAGSMRTDDAEPGTHAFVWSATAGIRDLGTFGGPNATVRALNDAGQAAGNAELAPLQSETAHHAFLWSAVGGLRDLGTLGGPQSDALAMNRSGQVVGQADSAEGADPRPHAFLWSDGTMQDLGTLGGPASVAAAINDSGQVVGRSALAGSDRTHAFIWTAAQGLVDLNTRVSGVELIDAFAISRSGAILAMSSGRFLVLLLPSS